MAETSGFQTDLQQSAYLSHTMRRAISAAQQRSHRYVTLEHLLFALMDDPDAQALLEGLRADFSAIKGGITDIVNRNLATLYTPGEFDLRASYKVERVLQTASDDARRLNCAEVDGAFVLAAVSREIDSSAADLVKRNGLGFTNAVTWLYANRGSRYARPSAPAPREAQPQPQPQQREVPPQKREGAPSHQPREAQPQPQPQAQVPVGRDQTSIAPQVREVQPQPHPREVQPQAREVHPQPPFQPRELPPREPQPSPQVFAGRDQAGVAAQMREPLPREPQPQVHAGRDQASVAAQPRDIQPERDAAPVAEPVAAPVAVERPKKVASPQALAEEEALELEFEVIDEEHEVQRQPAPQPQPQLQQREAMEPVYDRRPQPPRSAPAPVAKEEAPPPELRGAPVQQPPSPPRRAERAPVPAASRAPDPGYDASAMRRPERAPEERPNQRGFEDAAAMEAQQPVAAAPARRPEVPLERLEEMRVRAPSAAPPIPSPAPPPPPSSKAARTKKGTAPAPIKIEPQRRSGSRRQRALDAQAGKLVENIPRRMRNGVTERIEVRISREETEGLTKGLEGRGEVVRHDLLVTSAMSVMLRAPEGGFIIETLSPETQWITDGVERPADEAYGRWRWAVTPTEAGSKKLQVIVAARSVDMNGMIGDTALPDQVISVRVRTNYWRGIKSLLQWVVVMAAGGVMTELGVKIFHTLTKVP